MPGGDGTGPLGSGSMTGRAAGFCAGYQVPGYMNPAGGRGCFGRGRGFRGRGGGRGWRNRFFATGWPGWGQAGYGFGQTSAPVLTVEHELDDLKQQADFLQGDLKRVNQRIEQLEKEKAG